MKYLVIVIRTLLGVMFLFGGLSYFVNIVDMSETASKWQEPTKKFMEVMTQSNYFSVVKILEIIGGAFLLTGFFVPLGLTIIGPILVNILLFDFCLEKKADPPVLVGLVLFLGVFYAYRDSFRSVFAAYPDHCCSKKA
jgi:hypothetical protein